MIKTAYISSTGDVRWIGVKIGIQDVDRWKADTIRGVVTLSFSGWKGQRLVDIQATQAAIFHASKASSRW